MKIESLKVFCDLAETQSFSRAGQINEVTQSAVSQLIAAMEEIFGVRLVERGKRKSPLTPKGELVYGDSKAILGMVHDLENKLKETSKESSATIRLAAISSIGLYDLPAYLKRFLNDFPGANVQVECCDGLQVYDDVQDNLVDFGLVDYPIRDRDLHLVYLRKEPLVLACHPEHPLAKRKSVRLKALNGQKIIGFRHGVPTRRAHDSMFRNHHVTVDYAMELDSVDNVKRAVEVSSGLAILPLSTVLAEVASQTLAVLPFEDVDFSR